jgi:hypothetical protein
MDYIQMLEKIGASKGTIVVIVALLLIAILAERLCGIWRALKTPGDEAIANILRDRSAPYFSLLNLPANLVLDLDDEGRPLLVYSQRDGNVLAAGTNQVGDIGDGSTVVLMLQGPSEAPQSLKATVGGQPATIRREPEAPSISQGRWMLTYSLKREDLGLEQEVVIKWKVPGVSGVSRYATRHGQRYLEPKE